MDIRKTLHARRLVTEAHIRDLQRQGKAGERYTALMPDVPFLVLGLLCDAGWLIQLTASAAHLARGFQPLVLATALGVLVGVGFTIYLNLIHEKEIALGIQKDLSFGLTICAGLTGGIAGVLLGDGWLAAGGLLNCVSGFPIYISFQKGIRFGVQ